MSSSACAPGELRDFLKECLRKADDVEATLDSVLQPRSKRRRRDDESCLRILERVSKEAKTTREQATAQVANSQLSEYWACASAEQFRQYALYQKAHNDELAYRIAAYEHRFGRHF